MSEKPGSETPERRLVDIVREVKIAAADRDDVVVDIRDADRARLELLAEELAPIIAEIDSADERFDFGITSGQQPRFWIDAVAHVHMGRDRRIFRLVRDTRLGRVLIAESSEIKQITDAASRYIAERVIERERVLAGDFHALDGSAMNDATAEPASRSGSAVAASDAGGVKEARKSSSTEGFVIGASWFILGCVAGAGALVLAFWDRISAFLNP